MEQLIAFCRDKLQIDLNEKQKEQFITYQNELLSWNNKFNLTSITDPAVIEIKHFIDSLTCLLVIKPSFSTKIIDVGTGAGFPGIPIKILFPHIQILLIESTQKKAGFCQNLLEKFHFNPDSVLCGRAEEFAHQEKYREKFNIAVSRAVANLPTLLEYLLPFVETGGIAISMKGKNIQEELTKSKSALDILGGKLEAIEKYCFPITGEERNLVVIRKMTGTPGKYPRRPGIPEKKPLI